MQSSRTGCRLPAYVFVLLLAVLSSVVLPTGSSVLRPRAVAGYYGLA